MACERLRARVLDGVFGSGRVRWLDGVSGVCEVF
ncbi:hypothetical protein M3J09_013006 [Ascochyta lentis]